MRVGLGWLGAGLAATLTGCHGLPCDTCGGETAGHHGKLKHHKLKGTCLDVDNCSDIPQGAIPAPAGTYLAEYNIRQATKAEPDDLVFYYNEFLADTTTLGPFGAEHLARAVRRVEQTPFNLVLQPDEFYPPAVTLARRQFLVEQLSKAGVDHPDARVQIALPAAEGMHGQQAIGINPFPGTNGFGNNGLNSGQAGFTGANGGFGNSFGGGLFGGGFGGAFR